MAILSGMKKIISFITLLIDIIIVFMFLLGLFALFFSDIMISSMFGQINNEIILLNRYFGLILVFFSVLLFRALQNKVSLIFLVFLCLCFFICNSVLINFKLVAYSLGHVYIYYKILIYIFTILLLSSYLYLKINLKENIVK